MMIRRVVQGFGPAVVLIHGLGSCAEDWSLLQAPTWSQRYRVLMPDLRGHGRSDKPPAPTPSIRWPTTSPGCWRHWG